MFDFIKSIFKSKETKKYSICARDIAISLYYSIGTSLATALLPNIENLTMPTLPQIKVAVGAGLVVGIQHIIRKYLTNSEGVLLIAPENKENK